MSNSISIQPNKPIMLLEIILVAGLFLLVRELFTQIKYGSQIAEVVALIAITLRLRFMGNSWKDLGLRKPKNWIKSIGLFMLCVLTIGMTFNFIIAPLFPQGANDINHGQTLLTGEMLFQLFVIGIGTAAIGEELLLFLTA